MNKYELLSISPDDQFSKIIDHYRLLCKYFTKDNETDEEDTKYPLDFTKEDIDQAFCSFVKSEKQTPMLELLKREIYICGDEERKNDDELKKEIIENNDAYPLLVCACAGAGKTTTMVLKIVYLIKKLGYLPKEIVAFTFTEKAANELKQRVTMEISNPEPVNNPDSLVKKIQAEMRGMSYDGKDLNDLYLGTIHSFCFQLLKTYRKDLSSCEIVEDGELKLIVYKNFQILELTKNLPFHRKISKPLGGDKVKSNIDAYLRFINMMNEENVYLSNETRIPIPVEFETLFQKYQDVIIGKYKRIDFGSILRIFVNELRTNDELREYVKANIKVLIVDEYQDVNKIQEILVEEFYKLGTKIIVVGDDDQAIYQFRGCDEKFIVEFDKRYANTKKVILANNYRSTPHVILTAHQIVDNGFYPGERIEKEFKSAKKLNFPSEKNDIKKIGFSDVSELVNFVVRQIKILHTKNNIPYSEIAILGRGNKDIKIFKEALTSQNIPFSLKINLFEETEDKDLEFFLE
jgi:DNA helicase-2/ATP-dependent DNA helicase PcrA